jgi:phosphoribosylaminoimidazole carboxylase PurE protein
MMRKGIEMKPKVLILMGSESDLPVMEETSRVLDGFNIPYQITVTSAHRTPERTIALVKDAEKNGVDVVIAGAGMAAHLPGVVASYTILPVIGVPLDASPLKGLDALLSIVQMPPGIPVATVAVGKSGARNAGILAAQIIARKDRELAGKLRIHRERMSKEVEEKALKVFTKVVKAK